MRGPASGMLALAVDALHFTLHLDAALADPGDQVALPPGRRRGAEGTPLAIEVRVFKQDGCMRPARWCERRHRQEERRAQALANNRNDMKKVSLGLEGLVSPAAPVQPGARLSGIASLPPFGVPPKTQSDQLFVSPLAPPALSCLKQDQGHLTWGSLEDPGGGGSGRAAAHWKPDQRGIEAQKPPFTSCQRPSSRAWSASPSSRGDAGGGLCR